MLVNPSAPTSGGDVYGVSLSCAIIARNEAATIADCIESVLASVVGLSHEIVVVDSGSHDGTADIAARYPVRVVRLSPQGPLRPSIARHVGFNVTRGPYILFVDGDTILDPSWLQPAIALLASEQHLAGIAGACDGVCTTDSRVEVSDQYPGVEYDSPPHLSGSALYKREALTVAGDFDPHMRAAEEPELGARLRTHGYRLQRTRTKLGTHHRKAVPESPKELLRRVRRGYPIGLGQLARRALTQRLPVPGAVTAITRHLAFFSMIITIVVGAMVSLLTGNVFWVALPSGLLALGFLIFALKTGSLQRPAYYFLEWFLTSPMVAWGLLLRPTPKEPLALDRVVTDACYSTTK